ncbi:MAG: flavodoxin family protein [Campylobacter sp.]|nr:flavodoxin family protein [Campylobacter sp.]
MTIVIYSSLTGNTKKVAESIAKNLKADIKSIDDNIELQRYDKVIFGFYVDRGFMDKKTEIFAKNIRNKKMGIFITLGAEANSWHAKDTLQKATKFFENLGNTPTHTFASQGAIDPKLIEKMLIIAQKMGKSAPHSITKERKERWQKAKSHPDKTDLQNAKMAFADF